MGMGYLTNRVMSVRYGASRSFTFADALLRDIHIIRSISTVVRYQELMRPFNGAFYWILLGVTKFRKKYLGATLIIVDFLRGQRRNRMPRRRLVATLSFMLLRCAETDPTPHGSSSWFPFIGTPLPRDLVNAQPLRVFPNGSLVKAFNSRRVDIMRNVR